LGSKVGGSTITQAKPVEWQLSFVAHDTLTMYKSTTRHIRIFSAEIHNDELVPCPDKLTLDVDPDNELNWTDTTLQAVYQKFDELVAAYAGQDLNDYNLRRIGSELEHFVRSLLHDGQLTYNLQSRVRNYSLGLPRVAEDINV